MSNEEYYEQRCKALELQICKILPWVAAYGRIVKSFSHKSPKARAVEALVEETNKLLTNTDASRRIAGFNPQNAGPQPS